MTSRSESAPTVSTLPTLSVAGPEGSVRIPRRLLRQLAATRDDEAVLVGLALPFLVHPEGAVVAGARQDGEARQIALAPGECLVTPDDLAAAVGRPYGGYVARRALERLVDLDVIETRPVPGAGDRDAADRLVVRIKRWGLLEGPYA